MLKWLDPLYTDDVAGRRVRELKKRLDSGKTDLGHYVITLASNGTDCLDVMSTVFLGQPYVRNALPDIVGIASSKKQALKLVVRITEDCIRETGGYDVRRYLESRTHGA